MQELPSLFGACALLLTVLLGKQPVQKCLACTARILLGSAEQGMLAVMGVEGKETGTHSDAKILAVCALMPNIAYNTSKFILQCESSQSAVPRTLIIITDHSVGIISGLVRNAECWALSPTPVVLHFSSAVSSLPTDECLLSASDRCWSFLELSGAVTFRRHQLRSTHRHSYEELQVGDYRELSSKCRGLSEPEPCRSVQRAVITADKPRAGTVAASTAPRSRRCYGRHWADRWRQRAKNAAEGKASVAWALELESPDSDLSSDAQQLFSFEEFISDPQFLIYRVKMIMIQLSGNFVNIIT
uniref:Uncharacterized protein n=1 Tax=Rangifer tarandus platyrhynchus TaxID=3082113 RepID=A0ACB0EXJ5_RANTA|nr:unnamed protein product [Rangifer tarandus platyrhynchus]